MNIVEFSFVNIHDVMYYGVNIDSRITEEF